MRIEQKTHYVAVDGAIFYTETACQEYERVLHSIAENARSAQDVPLWIVNEYGELGVRVDGVNYYLYKGESLRDDDKPWRAVEKREFGEVCRPHIVREFMTTSEEDKCLKEWTSQYDWNPAPSNIKIGE